MKIKNTPNKILIRLENEELENIIFYFYDITNKEQKEDDSRSIALVKFHLLVELIWNAKKLDKEV